MAYKIQFLDNYYYTVALGCKWKIPQEMFFTFINMKKEVQEAYQKVLRAKTNTKEWQDAMDNWLPKEFKFFETFEQYKNE